LSQAKKLLNDIMKFVKNNTINLRNSVIQKVSQFYYKEIIKTNKLQICLDKKAPIKVKY